MVDTPLPNTADLSELHRQPSSALCFVCGLDNPYGLRVRFFDDGARVYAELLPAEHHQSWPGVLHGGILASLLDETLGRVAFIHDRWVQTCELTLRFHKPGPLDQRIRAMGEVQLDLRRMMEIRGRIVTVDSGELLAEASGTFVRIPSATRDEMAPRLGGDFSPWERWLTKNCTPATRAR